MTQARSAVLMAAVALCAASSRAEGLLPPWNDPDDVPLPTWAHSVAPKKAETVVVPAPGRIDARRATTLPGARLPLYGAVRAAGCDGRWLHVGLESWLCSDLAELSPEEPSDPPAIASDGLPYRYYFVGKQGANGYADLGRAGDEAPDEDLDPGFAIAVTDERTEGGKRWVHTRHGTWVAASDLGASRSSSFQGEDVGTGGLDFAWTLRDGVGVYATSQLAGRAETRPETRLAKRAIVKWREAKGIAVRISEDGAKAQWVDARALARPTLATPPPGVTGPTERWVDVEIATQTLVAYEGARPTFATLVSTGIGTGTSPLATHKGTFRIWVKLLSSTMDNVESPDNQDAHPATEGPRYSIEDVPYVQFFDRAIALHGVFWHDDFGHAHSHGCVNLAPRDAARLFVFTSPRLTVGLSAVLPARVEVGTVVRVR